jgi:hypothetical protein
VFFVGPAGDRRGRCASGGSHDPSESGLYRIDVSGFPGGQPDWRWCANCESLWFAGNGSMSYCPAFHSPSAHVLTSSSNYVLRLN